MLIKFERLWLQISFGGFQTAPPRVPEQPKPFLRHFPLGGAQSRLAQRCVKNFLRFA